MTVGLWLAIAALIVVIGMVLAVRTRGARTRLMIIGGAVVLAALVLWYTSFAGPVVTGPR